MDAFSVERSLIRLRVREHASYISKGDTVLATGASGFIEGGEEGLYVRQTRMLSRYRCQLGRRRPHPVTKSNVRQDSWMGYYIVPAPGEPVGDDAIATAAQLKLRSLGPRIRQLSEDGAGAEVVLVAKAALSAVS